MRTGLPSLTDDEKKRAILLQEFFEHKKIVRKHKLFQEDVLNFLKPESADSLYTKEIPEVQSNYIATRELMSKLCIGDKIQVKFNKADYDGTTPVTPRDVITTKEATVLGVYPSYITVRIKNASYNYSINISSLITDEIKLFT